MRFSFLLILNLFSIMSCAQTIIPLWPEGQIPNYINAGEKEEVVVEGITRIAKVQTPHIEVFMPSKQNATGEGILIFPGGGYHILAYDWEGTDIAKYFNARGIAAFVVKYRLPDDASSQIGHWSPFLDARRAIRLVRHHAADFNIMADKIGIMGFSAGGHLASTLSVHYDHKLESISDSVAMVSARPDFSILVYPVISFDPAFTHGGSKQALLGDNPEPSLVEFFSNEKQVSAETPPTILIHASDDQAVPVQNSLAYYEALVKQGVSAELHVYPRGGHGFSLATKDAHLRTWMDSVMQWLSEVVLPENK